MSVITVLLVILVIITVVLLVTHLKGGFTPYTAPSVTSTTAASQYKIRSPWSNPVASTDSQGQCQVYTFIGSNSQPATPNYSTLPACLGNNTCQIMNSTQTCTDADQILAQKVSHTCQMKQGPSAGTGCIKQDGTMATNGETEIYFRSCGNTNSQCGGTIALLDLTFNPSTFTSGKISTTQCISIPQSSVTVNPNNTITANIVAASCNIDDLTQLLRIERFDLNSDGSVSSDSSGLLGRITHRETGACLAPTMNLNAQGTYDPTNYSSSGALSLVPCSTGTMDGVWWGFVPPTPNPNNSSAAPQQLVYIPDVTKVPSDLTNATSVWSFLTSSSAIQTNVSAGSSIVMGNFNTGASGTGTSDTTNKQNNTQYIDYSLYNLIVNAGLSNYQF